MGTLDPVRLLILDAQDESPALLKSLLRGRIERPFVIQGRTAGAEPPEPLTYDVLILECEVDVNCTEKEVVDRIRWVLAHGMPPPLLLLGGTRVRSLEPVVLTAGAADYIWKEELSAPLLESQIRRAIAAREHAALERQFHEAQKMETVGRLAGGVAHDFNNILTAIVGFGSMLAEQVDGNAAAAENVAEILDAAERAAVLTRQLLAFGRRQVLHPVRLQIEEALNGVSSLIGRLIGDDIELKIACAPNVSPVRGDRAQIESAILNLVINARDAMPAGGRLSIEAHDAFLDEQYCATHLEVLPGRYVRLDVSDSGAGIPHEEQERIFEPFFSGNGLASNGLGLAAVYGVVKQSGGHIFVSSEPGVGTTFKVYLPVDNSTDEPVASEPAPVKAEQRSQGTILLVEDADGIRRLAGEVIRRAGYQVLEAADPSSALELSNAHGGTIDLLLTDIMMPGGTGIELAGKLLGQRPRLSVLYMSGYTDDAVIRNGMLASEAAFIQKPFTPKELLRRVKQILELEV